MPFTMLTQGPLVTRNALAQTEAAGGPRPAVSPSVNVRPFRAWLSGRTEAYCYVVTALCLNVPFLAPGAGPASGQRFLPRSDRRLRRPGLSRVLPWRSSCSSRACSWPCSPRGGSPSPPARRCSSARSSTSRSTASCTASSGFTWTASGWNTCSMCTSCIPSTSRSTTGRTSWPTRECRARISRGWPHGGDAPLLPSTRRTTGGGGGRPVILPRMPWGHAAQLRLHPSPTTPATRTSAGQASSSIVVFGSGGAGESAPSPAALESPRWLPSSPAAW